jgi:hypothetical protein
MESNNFLKTHFPNLQLRIEPKVSSLHELVVRSRARQLTLCSSVGRDLKHVRRQRDDDTEPKQINYCEEELLCIIHYIYSIHELSSV